MDKIAVKKMRTKQLLVTNGLILVIFLVYFLFISLFELTYKQLFAALGFLVLMQAIVGLGRLDSEKSLIPVFENVARYEKQKMGAEWKKQRRAGYSWNIVLSAFLFLQAYWYGESVMVEVQLGAGFTLIVALISAVLVNVSIFLHIRKVDHSRTPRDLRGYTWKSNLIAVAAGIVLAVVVMILIFSYILTTI